MWWWPLHKLPGRLGVRVPVVSRRWNRSFDRSCSNCRSSVVARAPRIPSASTTSSIYTLIFLLRVIIKVQLLALGWFLVSQEVGNILIRLEKDFDKIFGKWLVFIIVERCGETFIANASGTA
jgi:hypothetical protein